MFGCSMNTLIGIKTNIKMEIQLCTYLLMDDRYDFDE